MRENVLRRRVLAHRLRGALRHHRDRQRRREDARGVPPRRLRHPGRGHRRPAGRRRPGRAAAAGRARQPPDDGPRHRRRALRELQRPRRGHGPDAQAAPASPTCSPSSPTLKPDGELPPAAGGAQERLRAAPGWSTGPATTRRSPTPSRPAREAARDRQPGDERRGERRRSAPPCWRLPFQVGGREGLRAGADRGRRRHPARRPAAGTPLPVEIYVYALDEPGPCTTSSPRRWASTSPRPGRRCAQTASSSSAISTCCPATTRCGCWCATAPPASRASGWCRSHVPAFAQGEPVLLPPLLPASPPGRWLVIREEPRGEAQAPPAYPSCCEEPALHPGLAAGAGSRPGGRGRRSSATTSAPGRSKAEATVLTADGKEIGGRARSRCSAASAAAPTGPTALVATFQPPDLQPGEYVLRITVSGRRRQRRDQLAPLRRPPARDGAEERVRYGAARPRGPRPPQARAGEGGPRRAPVDLLRRRRPARRPGRTPPSARVFDAGGRPLGLGLHSPRSQIRVRMLGAGVEDADRAFFAARIAEALALRARRSCRRRPPATGCSTPRGTACRAGRSTASATCW